MTGSGGEVCGCVLREMQRGAAAWGITSAAGERPRAVCVFLLEVRAKLPYEKKHGGGRSRRLRTARGAPAAAAQAVATPAKGAPADGPTPRSTGLAPRPGLVARRAAGVRSRGAAHARVHADDTAHTPARVPSGVRRERMGV